MYWSYMKKNNIIAFFFDKMGQNGFYKTQWINNYVISDRGNSFSVIHYFYHNYRE